jgi:hypothetical protein
VNSIAISNQRKGTKASDVIPREKEPGTEGKAPRPINAGAGREDEAINGHENLTPCSRGAVGCLSENLRVSVIRGD